jgi:predicted nucleotidyltransferase
VATAISGENTNMVDFSRESWQSRLSVEPSKLADFCRRWRIAELALFGSILRDDFGGESDIDVLVTFSQGEEWSLMDWVQMRDELRQMLGRRVDLVEKQAIRNPFRRKTILDSHRVIYAS